jgi:hypothetical protein
MRVYCSECQTSFTELPDDANLSPNFKFTCKDCHRPDNRVQGLSTQFDPRFDRAGTPDGTAAKRPGPEEILREEFAHGGFQIDRKTPKPMKPGPEWSRSDAFLRELLTERSREEMGKALALIVGRWRRGLTFRELAEETHQSEEAVRKKLSGFRTEGDALWEKKERAAAKSERNRQLSVRANELFAQGLTVRQVADILKCSVGRASELKAA